MEGPGEAVGEMNFIIALRTPDCLPDSAPVQRPVDLVGPRVHVCSWGVGGNAWLALFHPPPILYATDLLEDPG